MCCPANCTGNTRESDLFNVTVHEDSHVSTTYGSTRKQCMLMKKYPEIL